MVVGTFGAIATQTPFLQDVLTNVAGDLIGSLFEQKADSVRDHLLKSFRSGVSPYDAATALLETRGDATALQTWRDNLGIGQRKGFALDDACGAWRCCPAVRVWFAIVAGLLTDVQGVRDRYTDSGITGESCGGGVTTENTIGVKTSYLWSSVAPRLAKRDPSVWPELVKFADRLAAFNSSVPVDLSGIQGLLSDRTDPAPSDGGTLDHGKKADPGTLDKATDSKSEPDHKSPQKAGLAAGGGIALLLLLLLAIGR